MNDEDNDQDRETKCCERLKLIAEGLDALHLRLEAGPPILSTSQLMEDLEQLILIAKDRQQRSDRTNYGD